MTDTSKNLARQRLLLCQQQDKETQQRLWHQFRTETGLAGEWIVAARLGETTFSEEQIHMVANLFGR
ncbi:hypothetical protein PT286_01440 [Neisseriaceae bacterium ESL0693]|nr:hypothetical protein [Neisseriaceae bacterium ESL0693]